VKPSAGVGEETLRRLDSLMLDGALTSVPGLHRDRGTLSAAAVALIGLGEPRIRANDGGWELRRAIGGGLLVRRPGGEIGFDCRDERGEVSISAILDGYAPRLPRPLYRLFQEPFHRRSVRRAVVELARRAG
jgi:hypothetical protein